MPQLTPSASTPLAASAARDELRRPAVGEAQLLAERHRGDDRQTGGGPDLADREQQLVEVVECLEDQQVHAAFEEPVELLAKCGPGRGVADPQVAVRGAAERPHGPRDQGIAPGNVTCLARELGAPPVEPGGEVAQAPAGEPDPIRAERGRLHEIGAGVEVLAMDRAHEVRPRQDELVEAGPLGDPAREEQRAGGAIGDQGPAGEPRPKAVALRRAPLGPGCCSRSPGHRTAHVGPGPPAPGGAAAAPTHARSPPVLAPPAARTRPAGPPTPAQRSEARVPRRRASVSEPSTSTNTSGGRGRPL